MSVLSSVAAGGYTLGTGRLVPSLAAVLGLLTVLGGVLALVRRNRVQAGVSAAAALVVVVVGGLHAAHAAGGLGTGNGLAGAWVAVVLGTAGVALGGSALARARQGRPDGAP